MKSSQTLLDQCIINIFEKKANSIHLAIKLYLKLNQPTLYMTLIQLIFTQLSS
jgi:hypothetical protein